MIYTDKNVKNTFLKICTKLWMICEKTKSSKFSWKFAKSRKMGKSIFVPNKVRTRNGNENYILDSTYWLTAQNVAPRSGLVFFVCWNHGNRKNGENKQKRILYCMVLYSTFFLIYIRNKKKHLFFVVYGNQLIGATLSCRWSRQCANFWRELSVSHL